MRVHASRRTESATGPACGGSASRLDKASDWSVFISSGVHVEWGSDGAMIACDSGTAIAIAVPAANRSERHDMGGGQSLRLKTTESRPVVEFSRNFTTHQPL